MKLAGVVFVLISACSVGVRMTQALKRRCAHLRSFLQVLQHMRNELTFRATPLPLVFRTAAEAAGGEWKDILFMVSSAMESNRWIAPKIAVEKALAGYSDVEVGAVFLKLSETLGSYDIQAQLTGIDCASDDIRQLLYSLEEEMSARSKTYKTLSICAGAALVILLI